VGASHGRGGKQPLGDPEDGPPPESNRRSHPQVKIPARGGKLPGTYQGRRGPRPLRGAVNGPGASRATHLHPSGVAAGHEPLTMEPPGTAVRTGVSPGHGRPSGPRLSVLFREVMRSRTATLVSGGAAGGRSVVVALADLASGSVGRRAVAPAWRLSAPYLAACPGRLGPAGRPAG
jgi:hypothetical protein